MNGPADTSAIWVATLMLFGALLVAALAFGLNRLASKRVPLRAKPWEGGARLSAKAWVQFRPRFALVALLFVAFDMEMVFMYPWGVAFAQKGLTAFGDMLVFIGVLSSALAFAWREGAFEWER